MPLWLMTLATFALAAIAQPLTYYGSVSEIEGDTTCGRDTGGLNTYVRTAQFHIYICDDPRQVGVPRFYRSFANDGSPGLSLAATTYEPGQGRYIIFDNGGYQYILDSGTAMTQVGLLIVKDPNGRILLEEVADTWLYQD